MRLLRAAAHQGTSCARSTAKSNTTSAEEDAPLPSTATTAGRVTVQAAGSGRELGVFEFLAATDFAGSLPPNATLRLASPPDGCGVLSGAVSGDWLLMERYAAARRGRALGAG